MKKTILLTSVLIFISIPAFSATISLSEILSKPAEFNGKLIEAEAEAIGEVLLDKKSNGAWINLSAKGHNLSVFSSNRTILSRIKKWGQYGQRGDWVRIEGVFKRDCPIHQISDIHLYSLEVIKKGYKEDILVSAWKIVVAIGLLIICLTSAIIYFIKVNYGART